MWKIRKRISEFLPNSPPPILEVTEPVIKAIELMRDKNRSAVLVVSEGRLVGIFTGRDFLERVAGPGLSSQTLLGEVMTRDPDTLSPADSIAYVIERMAGRGYRNVPIVVDGRPVGQLSVRDVISHLSTIFAGLESGDDRSSRDWIDLGGG